MILNGYQRIQDPAVVADLLPIRLAGFLNFLMLSRETSKLTGSEEVIRITAIPAARDTKKSRVTGCFPG